MADEQHSEEVQRWTAKRRAALVLSLLKGETTAADAAQYMLRPCWRVAVSTGV
jgi:hypothetical protein